MQNNQSCLLCNTGWHNHNTIIGSYKNPLMHTGLQAFDNKELNCSDQTPKAT